MLLKHAKLNDRNNPVFNNLGESYWANMMQCILGKMFSLTTRLCHQGFLKLIKIKMTSAKTTHGR